MHNGNLQSYLVQNSYEADHLVLIAEALCYLHTRDPVVIHGNIKISKILVTPSRQACLAPTWLSHQVSPGAAPDKAQNKTRFSLGNLRRLTSEVLKAGTSKEATQTTASDIFAFGRLIIEVITHEPPFGWIGEDSVVLQLVLQGKLPKRRPAGEEILRRGLDDRLWELVKDCSHTSPLQRPTAQQLVSRMQGFIERRSPSFRPRSY